MDLDEVNIEETVKVLIMEVMMVLYKYNIKEVHVGALMRLIGVTEEVATESDLERIILDEKFSKYMQNVVNLSSSDDSSYTLH
jgi:hypothetical protein